MRKLILLSVPNNGFGNGKKKKKRIFIYDGDEKQAALDSVTGALDRGDGSAGADGTTQGWEKSEVKKL